MTDLEFQNHAEALLKAVEVCCDRLNDASDADIDNQRVGSMVTLVFANKSQIVINLQKPLHEVWMSAKSGGYHYRVAQWPRPDSKGQGEFFVQLPRPASAQAGMALEFAG